ALAAASSVTFTQTLTTAATSTSNARGAFAIYKRGADPATVYLASGEPSSGAGCAISGDAGAVRVSTDGGATWGGKLPQGGGFCGGQCFYDIGLAVNPGAASDRSQDLVLLGGSFRDTSTCARINARSIDGGATYTDQDTSLHADVHAITFAPSNSTIVY